MIHNLKSQGLSITEISRQLGLDRKTVRKHLRANGNDVKRSECDETQANSGRIRPI